MKRALLVFAVFLLAIPSAAQQSSPTSDGKNSEPPLVSLSVVKKVPVSYPIDARANQIQGRVILIATVDEKGNVRKLDVLHGDPSLVEAAKDSVKKWQFEPAMLNGTPIQARTKVKVDFAFSSSNVTPHYQDPAPTSAGCTTKVDPGTGVEVKSGVIAGRLLRQVTPVYPRSALRQEISGTVVFRAVIGTDGDLADLRAISGPSELIPAATGAVEQWHYVPYMLCGEPVAVTTTINVNFELRR